MPLKPRLLFFVTEDWSFLSHRLGIAKAAMAAGYDVSLITQVKDGAAVIEGAGIHLYPLPIKRSGMNPWRELMTFLRVVRLYHHIKPDLVHQVAMKPVVYGSLAARLVGIDRRVNALVGLGFVFSSPTLKARLIKPFLKCFLFLALSGKNARLILQNADDFDFFKTSGLAPSSSLRLIRGSGVDPDKYHFTHENVEQTPLVVLPSRLLKDKGVREFVDAARIVKNKKIKARFALVGEPDPQNPASFTEKEIKAWTDEGVVECWGWRKDMIAVLAESNIVCLPSYREGLPKALLEAASCGRAMVTTDVPGCREIVKKDENGWIVPAGDALALAVALEQAILRPDLRALYAKRSRKLIEDVFGQKYIHEQTLAVYNETKEK